MPVSLYISLFAAGEAVLSEPCNVLQPKVGLLVRLCFPRACSSMSTPELWSCLLLEEHVCVCVCHCACARERRDSDASRGELWSYWSVTNVLHLSVRTSEAHSQVQVRVKGEQHSGVCVFQVGFYFTLVRASISTTMLNILLSALIDPDRRLRSFRRSERLASILVCIIYELCLFLLYIFACVFQHVAKAAWFSWYDVGQTNKLETHKYWFCPRYGMAAVRDLIISSDFVLGVTWPFLEIILLPATFRHVCSLWPVIF